MKKYDEVVKDCTLALSLDKKHVKSFQRRAMAHVGLKQLELAMADFKQASTSPTSLWSSSSGGNKKCPRNLANNTILRAACICVKGHIAFARLQLSRYASTALNMILRHTLTNNTLRTSYKLLELRPVFVAGK